MVDPADQGRHPGAELSGYVDGELDAAAARMVEAHLAGCPECRALADDLLRMKAPAGDVPVDAGTERRFLDENRRRRSVAAPRRTSRPSRLIEATLAIAAAAVITIGVFVALGGPLRNMFSNAVGTGTMGQNQASLSAGIY